MNKGYTKGAWALKLKQDLRLSKGLEVELKDYKLATNHNVGLGYYFPEHIKMRGEHHDYYTKEFAELINYLFNNLEDIIDGRD